mgnify:CR=1 FL=1
MRIALVLLIVVFCTVGIQRSFSQQMAEVLVIGGGASGTAAAIQAARMGVKVVVLEETTWLGGMLTAAGVSAIDGNHEMPSGIWGEFREKLYAHYGGPQAVGTGWVSHTLFEPSVGNRIFQDWLKSEPNIEVVFQAIWTKASFENGIWEVSFLEKGKTKTLTAKILIDATELGDVAASLGYDYFVGMDSRDRFGEQFAPDLANDIIQDLTYVVVLKDFGPGKDKTIPKPSGYDPSVFRCACDHADPISNDNPQSDCQKMLDYGKLPNGKLMINWPNCGNDFYLNLIDLSRQDRMKALEEAKLHSLRFVYYIQHELGFSHLGLADDEFPSEDKLPLIPYHRESRRVISEAMLTLSHVLDPFSQPNPLYKTGVAVGDYTIDHHHKMNPGAPAIDFIKIRVPSYNVPLGSLVPKGSTHLVVAEKSIGVSNIVNGASRLQPVVLGIGQAAGALAATAILDKVDLQKVEVRKVQQHLLDQGAYIMPYIDVKPDHPHFQSIQRVGATGIVRGSGVPYKWANQTWFYPNREISQFELVAGLRPLYPQLGQYWSASGDVLTPDGLLEILRLIDGKITKEAIADAWTQSKLDSGFSHTNALNRCQTAVLLDALLDPFSIPVGLDGNVHKKD